MARYQQIACNECGKTKGETNHWIKSIQLPDYEGILFVPAEAASPNIPGAIERDQCGQACAHKALSLWLEDLRNIDFPNPSPNGEQQ